jgi:hypothetical protein
MSDTFTYHGETLECVRHMYNLTMLNERAVELAIAHRFLDRMASPWHRDQGLEVGNVLGHYYLRCHRVWDLHERPAWYQERQDVSSIDILEVPTWGSDPKFPWVVSISTIEHTERPLDALQVLKSLVAPSGRLLVTFPTGVSDDLDWLVAAHSEEEFDRSCTIARTEYGWAQTPTPTVLPYGQWANSVFVGEWENTS